MTVSFSPFCLMSMTFSTSIFAYVVVASAFLPIFHISFEWRNEECVVHAGGSAAATRLLNIESVSLLQCSAPSPGVVETTSCAECDTASMHGITIPPTCLPSISSHRSAYEGNCPSPVCGALSPSLSLLPATSTLSLSLHHQSNRQACAPVNIFCLAGSSRSIEQSAGCQTYRQSDQEQTSDPDPAEEGNVCSESARAAVAAEHWLASPDQRM